MKFCPGTIVKIMAGATAEYIGRLGVVTDFDEEENLYNNTSVAVLDGDGDIELVMEFEEDDLIGCCLPDDVDLAIASHIYGNTWKLEQAANCKHMRIERLEGEHLKCIDCGLRTSDMKQRTAELVQGWWRKRLQP